MYGYKEFVPLTAEEIFKRVSQEDVFKLLIKDPIIVGKGEASYIAPYRNDSSPDCYFEEHEGRLFFVDFASSGKKQKDCLTFLKDALSLNYREVLEYINETFDLGLGNSIKEVKKIKVENSHKVEDLSRASKKKRTITYAPRQFSGKDRSFWEKYEISKQNLIDDGVIPIEAYRSINRKGEYFSSRPMSIMYAYTDFVDKEKVKIYRPYGNKFEKWFTNCSQNDIGSLEFLPETGDLLIISKSYKDCRVIRNQGLNSVWFQNEGMLPSVSIIEDLCIRFVSIVIWFDNDQAGIANGRIVTDYINSISPDKAKLIFLPPKLLKENIKDPSDLIKLKGKKNLVKFLKQKELV